MKLAVLSPNRVRDRESLHAALARQLDFPAWYGGNLDALYDLLTAEGERVCILLLNRKKLASSLGEDYDRLLAVLEDVNRETGRVTVVGDGKS